MANPDYTHKQFDQNPTKNFKSKDPAQKSWILISNHNSLKSSSSSIFPVNQRIKKIKSTPCKSCQLELQFWKKLLLETKQTIQSKTLWINIVYLWNKAEGMAMATLRTDERGFSLERWTEENRQFYKERICFLKQWSCLTVWPNHFAIYSAAVFLLLLSNINLLYLILEILQNLLKHKKYIDSVKIMMFQ